MKKFFAVAVVAVVASSPLVLKGFVLKAAMSMQCKVASIATFASSPAHLLVFALFGGSRRKVFVVGAAASAASSLVWLVAWCPLFGGAGGFCGWCVGLSGGLRYGMACAVRLLAAVLAHGLIRWQGVGKPSAIALGRLPGRCSQIQVA